MGYDWLMKRNRQSVDLRSLGKDLRSLVWEFGPRGADGECFRDLSMAEFIALEKILDAPGCSVQDIGTKLGFTRSGATRIVTRLARKRYVAKTASEADARVCCVVANERGQAALAAVEGIYSRLLENMLATLSDGEREMACRSIRTLARTLK